MPPRLTTENQQLGVFGAKPGRSRQALVPPGIVTSTLTVSSAMNNAQLAVIVDVTRWHGNGHH